MKIRRLFAFALSAAMACGLVFSAQAAENSGISYDFDGSDSGFTPIFADYPAREGVEDFYEFAHSYGAVPIDGAGNGLYISGNNHSDDLFMGWYKEIDGFEAEKTYRYTVSFKLATDVEGGMVGVGGSPGDSVYVKCGVTPIKPEAAVGEGGDYRLNIDKSNQAQSGKDMRVVGTLTKELGLQPGAYEFNNYTAEFDVTVGAGGSVYVIFGTDSGFEATSSWYLDDVSVSWTEVKELTRAEAAQMLYDALSRFDEPPEVCTFRDVAADSPYAGAIGGAQERGYLNGYGGGQFGPEDSMTVEQVMVMIHRCMGAPDAESYMLDYLEYYSDSDQVSQWARNAIAWMLSQGLMQVSDSIAPRSPMTSVDLARILAQIVIVD